MAIKTDKQHSKYVNDLLKGRTIKSVGYMSEEESESNLWHKRPACIRFTDGSVMILMCDDEGNDGGSAWFSWWGDDENGDQKQEQTVIYTI